MDKKHILCLFGVMGAVVIYQEVTAQSLKRKYNKIHDLFLEHLETEYQEQVDFMFGVMVENYDDDGGD